MGSSKCCMWLGPFDGYLKLTPYNTTSRKSQTLFFKTLEETQNAATTFEGRIGGITKIGNKKYTLRKGEIVFSSPKEEKSWIYCKNYGNQYEPEVKGPFKLPKGLSWKKTDIKDEHWFVQKKISSTKHRKEWQEWKYAENVYLLNPITNEIKDINTKQIIGNRVVYLPINKKYGESFEVFVWCVSPY